MRTGRPVVVDYVGRRFGRLVVLARLASDRRGTPWLCECDCGATTVVAGRNLRSGNTTSCGCVRRELRSALNRTHGRSRTPEYVAWVSMHTRCRNASRPDFKDYGGRGITICPEWLGPGKFEAFLAHIGPRPSAKHSLDRIDNNGNYEPGNVHWATKVQQMNNRRKPKPRDVTPSPARQAIL